MRYLYKITYYVTVGILYIPAWIVEYGRRLAVWLLKKEMQLKYPRSK